MTRQAQRLSSQSAKSVPVLDPNNDGVGGRRPSGLSTEFFDRAKAQSGILSAPSFLYGEDKPGAIFGFFHIETLSARSNLEERQHGLHRHPDFDQLLIMTRGDAASSTTAGKAKSRRRAASIPRPTSCTGSSIGRTPTA
jgi:hypothetical protein